MAQPLSVISVTQRDPDQGVYTVKQVSAESGLAKGPPLPKGGSADPGARIDLDRVSFGPLEGFVRTGSLDAAFSVSFLGIYLGSFFGNLQQGLSLEVDLAVGKGNIKFYLKNGHELWTRLDLQPKVGGGIHNDYKLDGW